MTGDKVATQHVGDSDRVLMAFVLDHEVFAGVTITLCPKATGPTVQDTAVGSGRSKSTVAVGVGGAEVGVGGSKSSSSGSVDALIGWHC